eukprot:GFUD01115745.1.p1 GENE.GFUD01115745.1~~GFUD01115745.1.p1  ORF type:complete len:182 (-),score=77.73 GFUD01115745.1:50-595(-)
MSGKPCVWVMGGPGSGKGTQCALLQSLYSYSHLSTGDLLRSEVLAGTERWIRLFQTIQAGELAPDDEVIALLAAAVEKQTEAAGFLFDGFPANMAQARLCQDKLGSPAKVVVLVVPDSVMVDRLKDGVNFNDTEETIKKRIQTFSEETQPVIQAYADVASKVKADRTSEEVFADIKNILDR